MEKYFCNRFFWLFLTIFACYAFILTDGRTDDIIDDEDYDEEVSGDHRPGHEDEDEDEYEESGSTTLTACQEDRQNVIQRGSPKGSWIPKCTANGQYEARQCDSANKCWCVDFNGQQIPRPASDEYKDCTNIDRSTGVNVRPSKPSTKKPNGNIDSSTDIEFVMPEEVEVATRPPSKWITSEPWIIPVIIGVGSLVLLACVICVVITVYCRRKKDEGSYTLDEPKKALIYNHRPEREFFA